MGGTQKGWTPSFTAWCTLVETWDSWRFKILEDVQATFIASGLGCWLILKDVTDHRIAMNPRSSQTLKFSGGPAAGRTSCKACRWIHSFSAAVSTVHHNQARCRWSSWSCSAGSQGPVRAVGGGELKKTVTKNGGYLVLMCPEETFGFVYTAKLLDKNRLATGPGYPQVLKPK